MSDYIVKDTELTSVANAIRTKGGTNSQLVFPGGFVSAIGNISGGGGSSDFSTAEITIYNNTGDNNVQVSAVCINNDKLEYIFLGINEYSNTKIYAVLYKGESAGIDISHGTSVINISGDITYDEETFMYYATGDCTITIS